MDWSSESRTPQPPSERCLFTLKSIADNLDLITGMIIASGFLLTEEEEIQAKRAPQPTNSRFDSIVRSLCDESCIHVWVLAFRRFEFAIAVDYWVLRSLTMCFKHILSIVGRTMGLYRSVQNELVAATSDSMRAVREKTEMKLNLLHKSFFHLEHVMARYPAAATAHLIAKLNIRETLADPREAIVSAVVDMAGAAMQLFDGGLDKALGAPLLAPGEPLSVASAAQAFLDVRGVCLDHLGLLCVARHIPNAGFFHGRLWYVLMACAALRLLSPIAAALANVYLSEDLSSALLDMDITSAKWLAAGYKFIIAASALDILRQVWKSYQPL